MRKREEYTIIYAVGAVGYSIIEILWRGFTHWTMTLTGGLCFLSYHIVNMKHRKESLIKKCFLGCGIITSVELVVGCLVNKIFRWNVWDYSHLKLNILGQICPLYSGLWFLLCMPMTLLSSRLKKYLLTVRHAHKLRKKEAESL